MTDARIGTDDLSSLPSSEAPRQPGKQALARKRTMFAGFTGKELGFGALALLLCIWAMWVTKSLVDVKPQHIVKADLSRIVGDYVQAQARSATPPDQVQAQMRAFMASLDTELQRRGANGEVVLVGEAVLSKSVPDITKDVAKAVYASGVKAPEPASSAQMGAMMRGQAPTGVAPVAAPVAAPPVQVPTVADTSGVFGAPLPEGQGGQAPAPADQPLPGAAVSTFGGPGGQ